MITTWRKILTYVMLVIMWTVQSHNTVLATGTLAGIVVAVSAQKAWAADPNNVAPRDIIEQVGRSVNAKAAAAAAAASPSVAQPPAPKRTLAGAIATAKDEIAVAPTAIEPTASGDTNALKCVLTNRICAEGPETRMSGGPLSIPIYRACWRYEDKWACSANQSVDDVRCNELKAMPNCYLESTTCDTWSHYNPTDPPGTPKFCLQYNKVFKCTQPQLPPTPVTSCNNTGFCMDGKCFSNDYVPNTDMNLATSVLESGRQAGMYVYTDPVGGLYFFKGSLEGCREGWGGVRKCCDEQAKGATPNSVASQVALQAIMQGAKYGWNYLVTTLSPYVYDLMYQSTLPYLMEQGLHGLNMIELNQAGFYETGSAAAAAATFVPQVSFAGFTVSYGAITQTQMLGSTTLNSVFGAGSYSVNIGGNFYLYFNPVMFVIMILVMIYMYLSSCTNEEKMLANERGSNLCYANGSYCSWDTWFGCMETTFQFCCFNSVLAKIINQQGRRQLGMPIPGDCNGFNYGQINSLDFSRIDFSEFYNSIAPIPADAAALALWTRRGNAKLNIGVMNVAPNLQLKKN